MLDPGHFGSLQIEQTPAKRMDSSIIIDQKIIVVHTSESIGLQVF